jgi:hypothetical protein
MLEWWEENREMLKKKGGSVVQGIVLFLALVLVIGGMIYGLIILANNNTINVSASLPLLAIGGVIVLILMLTIVAMIFGYLGLTNKDQAMGLPEGSIRAVIALSLIVLFAILAVFLYEGVRGQVNTVDNLSDADRVQFLKDHSTARDLTAQVVKDQNGQPLVVKDQNGQPLKNPDGTPLNLYTVTYRSTSPAGDDFAKQLLVLLGTLMTAITSFYLGAGTATSAAAAAAAQTTDLAKPPPVLTGINPTVHSISHDGLAIKLRVMGNNLNIFTHVKIVRAGVHIDGVNVSSNPTLVTCEIAVSATTTPPGPPWDVVVDDGASMSATLPGALTITD